VGAAERALLLQRRHGLAACLLVLVVTPCPDVPAADEVPPAQVIATAAEVFAGVVATRRAELEADLREDHAMVDEYLLPHFDLTSACRLILREHWQTATPEQRRRFIDAFYRYLLVSYGDALLEFRYDTIKVLPVQQDTIGSSTRVRTQMKLTGGSIFDVDYYMRRDDRGWLIVDVIAEGISYVRTYRSEYGLEIRAEGLKALTARLEEEAAGKQ
jgi:phospholipid transport system substrate-binding protein